MRRLNAAVSRLEIFQLDFSAGPYALFEARASIARTRARTFANRRKCFTPSRARQIISAISAVAKE
jgi:hypothetical protein